jgi:hypothetical protein
LIDSDKLPEHFWSKVSPEPNSGCWLWTAYIDKGGYGNFRMGRQSSLMAHRVAYEALVGDIPAGLVVDHSCRTRCCVNPEHLEPVTQKENTARMSRHRDKMLEAWKGGLRYEAQ